jgi:hypothetical protein
VDLSTITAATDLVMGTGDPLALLYDLNFQSGRDPEAARRARQGSYQWGPGPRHE